MRFVCVDIETTGLDPRKHSVLELAAVAYDFEDPNYREEFHHLTSVRNRVWDDDTLKFHLPRLSYFYGEHANRVEIHTLFPRLRDWALDKVCLPDDEGMITCAGKNFASFDFQFIKELPCYRADLINYGSLDLGSMIFNPKTDRRPPRVSECMKRMGVITNTGGAAHTALADAEDTAKTILKYYSSKR